ncbi:mobilization protein [Streptomyces sp. IMTB 2501]|uniref:plasmid mobilization relaxosome protein MobC n=1 Tax=Streptomyces sp. IMTB 2501 TaxID=1776340 RepID=UPI00096E441D|nr:plasmid mobilization relaxosome protein MobC [Streptomyces sp. IMTB 2501]OLZ67856.1 mobilization protein [Streptomyces sp. IMTB 2501]
MSNLHTELPASQQEVTTTVTQPARYAAGPSKGGLDGDVSAPGVAEALGHRGAPEGGQPTGTAAAQLPRAAEAAALHRVARRRKPDPNGQRKQRVDARYSLEEKAKILGQARKLNVSGAYLVGAAVMAYIDGDLTLPGQRTPLDDYIDELNALRSQVAKIGNNINQIARKLNSGGRPHPGDTAVLAQAERTLTAVRATIGDIATAANQAVSKKAAW